MQKASSLVTTFISGLFFGLGLILSGMTDPSKVIGFLDLTGAWDPSLGFVMAGAILVGAVAFHFAGRRPVSLLGESMRVPTSRGVDRRLVLGGITFGAGWGLAGFCPGPALASLASAGSKAQIFVVAMLVGMAVYEASDRLKQVRPRSQTKAN